MGLGGGFSSGGDNTVVITARMDTDRLEADASAGMQKVLGIVQQTQSQIQRMMQTNPRFNVEVQSAQAKRELVDMMRQVQGLTGQGGGAGGRNNPHKIFLGMDITNLAGGLRGLRRTLRYIYTIRRAGLLLAALPMAFVWPIKLANDLEKTKLSMETLMGSASAVDALFTKMSQMRGADLLGQSGMAGVADTLQTAGISGDQLLKTMQAITTFSVARGTGAAGAKELAGIFEDMAMQPGIALGQIESLQKKGIPALQMLAQAYGQSDYQMRSTLEQGIIRHESAIRIITVGMEKKYADAAARGRNISENILTEIKNTILDKGLTSFGQGVDKWVNGPLQQFRDFIQSPQAGDFFANMGRIAEGFGKVLNDIAFTIKDIYTAVFDESRWGDQVNNVWDRFGIVMLEWWNRVGKEKAIQAGEAIAGWIGGGIAKVIRGVWDAFFNVSDAKTGAQKMAEAFGQAFIDALDRTGTIRKVLTTRLKLGGGGSPEAGWSGGEGIPSESGGTPSEGGTPGFQLPSAMDLIGKAAWPAIGLLLARRFVPGVTPLTNKLFSSIGGIFGGSRGTSVAAHEVEAVAGAAVANTVRNGLVPMGGGIFGAGATAAEPAAAQALSQGGMGAWLARTPIGRAGGAISGLGGATIQRFPWLAPAINFALRGSTAELPYEAAAIRAATTGMNPLAATGTRMGMNMANWRSMNIVGKAGGGLTALFTGLNFLTAETDRERTLAITKGLMGGAGAVLGGLGGSALLPGIGTLAGGVAGGWAGGKLGESTGTWLSDVLGFEKAGPHEPGQHGKGEGHSIIDMATSGTAFHDAAMSVQGFNNTWLNANEDVRNFADRSVEHMLEGSTAEAVARAEMTTNIKGTTGGVMGLYSAVRELTIALRTLTGAVLTGAVRGKGPGGGSGPSSGSMGLTIGQTTKDLMGLGYNAADAADLVQYACGAIAVAGIAEAAGDTQGAKFWIDKAKADYHMNARTGMSQMDMNAELASGGISVAGTFGADEPGKKDLFDALGRGELAAINMVGLNLGHHLVGSAVDEQGRIYVGNSMKAYSGGKDWMTLAEIEAVTGAKYGGANTYAKGGNTLHGYSLGQLRGGSATPSASSSAAGTRVETGSHGAFVNSLFPLAKEWEAKTGIPAEYFIAANISESNWGAAPGNMLFGIKARPGHASTGPVGTWEAGIGATNRSFTSYNSPNDAYADFIDLISTTELYKPAWSTFQKTNDPARLFRDLTAAGYATDDQWGNKVAAIATTTVPQLLTGGRGPGGGGAPVSVSFGEGSIVINVGGTNTTQDGKAIARSLVDAIAGEMAKRYQAVADNMTTTTATPDTTP